MITKGVYKSSDTPLSLPLRHGILHGRSVNYASKTVCCKAWLLLIALIDWANDKSDEDIRRNRHLADQKETLRDALERRALVQEEIRQLENWEPVIANAPFVDAFETGSPGEAFKRFFEGWEAKNYGAMAAHATNLTGKSRKKMAGELRQQCELIELLGFDLLRIEQATSVRADASLMVRGNALTGPVKGKIDVLAIRYLPDGELAMPTDENGTWCVQQNCIYKVMHLDRLTD